MRIPTSRQLKAGGSAEQVGGTRSIFVKINYDVSLKKFLVTTPSKIYYYTQYRMAVAAFNALKAQIKVTFRIRRSVMTADFVRIVE